MKHWNKRWVKATAFALLAIGCLATISEARHRFRFWWFRPPAPAVENSDYAGDVSGGRLRTIVVAEGEVVARERVALDDGKFTAQVIDGVLTIDPFQLSATTTDEEPPAEESLAAALTTTTTVDVILDEATLRRNFFGSRFFARGTAIIETTVDDGKEPPPEEEEPPVLSIVEGTPIDVFVFGSIHQHDDGTYHLRGAVRGFDRSGDDETGETTYTIFSARLNGEGEVIVEEEPPEEEPPTEEQPAEEPPVE